MLLVYKKKDPVQHSLDRVLKWGDEGVVTLFCAFWVSALSTESSSWIRGGGYDEVTVRSLCWICCG